MIQTIIPHILNIFSADFLPILVPFLAYWIYSHRANQNEFKDKVVLITGASSGLGEAVAHVFHKSGSKVILAARSVDQLERVKADLINSSKNPNEPVVFPIDLSSLESIPEKASALLSIYNGIDLVICNAGVSHRGTILETSLDVQMKVMTVNYFGQIALINALLPSLIKRKGHVMAISSVQGRISLPYRSAYAASKHALQAYMDCLRSEVPDITVSVINPGYIKTNMSINAFTASGQKYGVLDSTTAKGYSAEYVAEKIMTAAVRRDKEVTIAPILPRLAILFRVIAPSLFFIAMKFWAKKKN
ncbi:hypothetical protein O3M35_001320 [Rhynocoris fuscipes]|uniref:Ketoreductase domain-containing protein n=1 Tax=Rhynocoris fuscipes TaxID=488301 RepID=A0AAW1DUA6_9HEMI